MKLQIIKIVNKKSKQKNTTQTRKISNLSGVFIYVFYNKLCGFDMTFFFRKNK